jgi:phospholipid-binding lipoprotein MlaA
VNRSTSTRTALAAAVAALLWTLPGASLAGETTPHSNDPLAGLNRPIFRFNDALDRGLLEPVAKGYDVVMPDLVQGWVTNFFSNLWFPVTFTNCVLQAKPRQATQSLARFVVNTTAGLGGFGDPATRLDIPAPNEDFGQTLGYWGVGPGPYLVIPVLGPSNVRDTVGRAADNAARVWPWFVPWYASSSAGVLEVLNTRARYLEDIRDLRESSIDYYSSVRDAYQQRRAALVEDRVGSAAEKRHLESENDLYFPEESEGSPQ